MDAKGIIGKDGILRCEKCGKPIEKEIQFPLFDGSGGTVAKKVKVMCDCQRAEREKIEKKQRQEDDIRAVESLRRLSLMDERLSRATLATFTENDDNGRLLRIINNYISNFDRMFAESQGLLFWGPVGTGKSYAAAVIANELLQRKVSVVMTSFVKLLKGALDEKEAMKADRLNDAKLLIVDDLGAERGTDFALEKVYDIVDSRYRSDKPMILTTNLTMDQMKHCDDIRYARIYDRIFEMCYPVKVDGLSWRKREAAARFADTRKILEGRDE